MAYSPAQAAYQKQYDLAKQYYDAGKGYGSAYGSLGEWEMLHPRPEATPAADGSTDNTAGLGGYAGGAADQNLAAAPKNQELAALINTVNATAQKKLNDARLGPAGVSAQDQQLENINRSAQGYLGEDYVRQMQNRYAGEAGNSGMGVDSSNWNAALERTLGLETKKIQDESIGQLATLYGENPAAKLYGMESGNISAGDYASAQNQRYATDQRQNEYSQNLALDYEKLAEQKRAAIESARLTDIANRIKNREISPTWNVDKDPYRTKSTWGGNTPNGLYSGGIGQLRRII